MLQSSLRKKILSGYLLVTFLMVILVSIAFYQFITIGKRVKYLKEDVAGGVIVANDIKSEILSMRTAVEKYIFLNKETDKKRAEKHIEHVLHLLTEARGKIHRSSQLDKLKIIDETSNEFIDKFKKVAIRITAANSTKKELFERGESIENKLNLLIKSHQEEYNLEDLNVSLTSLKKFVSAQLEVNRFLMDNQSEYSLKGVAILKEIIAELEKYNEKYFKEIIIDLEDYMDSFEGLASVLLKMTEEINQTIIPLAPKIVRISREVADSGWHEMERFSLDVEKGVKHTAKWMLIIGIFSIVIGFIMGFLIARIILKPIMKVVDFASKVSKGDTSEILEIKQEDEIGRMAEALNNILIDMLGTQQKLMNNLDRLPTPVIEVDKSFTILSINQEGARLIGKKPEQMIGGKCYDFYTSAHCQTPNCILHKAMEKDTILTGETTVLPDGLNMPIRYTGFPVKDRDGQIIGSIKYVLNISGERKINDEIRRLIDAVSAGDLEKKADSTGFTGSYAELINNANEIVEAFLKPLKESQEVLKNMAEGDLTIKMEGDYRGDHAMMKNSINNVLESFNTILHQVGQASEDVTASSTELASFSQSLSEGAQQQAASVEQISASIHQTDQQINMNADNASVANELASETAQAALSGKEEMRQMIEAMEDIYQSSKNISKVINVINDIASQTNILALNATVEAVRAGQFGQSFAVIAQEVRNLAGRSAQAVKETAEMIETSNKKVTEGVNIAERTNVALEKIVGNVVKVRDIVEEINISSKEQAVAMSQLNDGMGQISSATQNMSTRSEETAGAAVQLKSLANELKNQISKFTLSPSHSIINKTRTVDAESSISQKKNEKNKSIAAHNIDWLETLQKIPLDEDERGYSDF